MVEKQKPGYRSLRKGRYSQAGGIYFVTTVTRQRIPWFQVFDFARLLCRELQRPAYVDDAQNLCWVVMPDHLHLLIQLEATPLDRVMNRLKSRSALALNREIGRTGGFWEPGYHDRALRSEDSLREVARYIVANPLRAGLVRKIGDYPFWNAIWL